MKPIEIPKNLFRAHLLFQKMGCHPEHFREIREVFLEVIERKRLGTTTDLKSMARENAGADGLDENKPEVLEEYTNALIDLLFATSIEPEEWVSYINLARKIAKSRELARVLHWESASSHEIARLVHEFCDIPLGDRVIPVAEAVGVRVALINHFISNQLPYIGIAKKHISIRDINETLKRTFWTSNRSGRIGGKAAGMILAQKIILPFYFDTRKEFRENIRVPDSYFLRSDIFAEFIQENNMEAYHSRKYESREKIEEEFPKIQAQFDKACFSRKTIDHFRKILEEIGTEPIIARSSSFLEDNFGLAFSGKYDSVFLTNQGDLETRLAHFLAGVKQVHMSTYHPNPISYRQDHNLLDFNENMAMLVQKVVGRRYGDYFFPFIGGVAFSTNSFIWNPKIDRQSGLIRMAFGLGTRAVDRIGGDYTRMVPLSHPTLRPEGTAVAIRKYSQKKVDLLNLKTGQLESHRFVDIMRKVNHPEIHLAISLAQGDHLAPPVSRLATFEPEQATITFERLLKETSFPTLVRDMVQTVAKAYGRAVDMEFAYDDGKLYLLQCRTQSLLRDMDRVVLPTEVQPEKLIFTIGKTALPNRVIADLEYIVYVDPLAYNKLASREEKLQVARVVNRCNQALSDKRFGLFGPGRWGSNDINLGVPVGYHDINRTRVLGEVAFTTDGDPPEVSFGTHFFNDLIEADIVPLPIYPDEEGAVFNRQFFVQSDSLMLEIAPEYDNLAEVIRVIHIPSVREGHYFQIYLDGSNARGMGFLAPRSRKNTV